MSYLAPAMFSDRRATVFAVLAFLLALVPATTAARAQLIRWVELDPENLQATEVGVLIAEGTYAGRPMWYRPQRRADVAEAKFIGVAAERVLTSKILDQEARLLTLDVSALDQSPGWVVLTLQPVLRDWTTQRWRSLVVSDGLTDPVPGKTESLRVRGHAFFKALVHRGNSGRSQAVTQPVGQLLEIVPLQDPGTLGGNVLPIRLLLRGKPVPGATVWVAAKHAAASGSIQTDAKGEAMVPLRAPGWWILRATVAEPGDGKTVDAEVFTATTSLIRS